MRYSPVRETGDTRQAPAAPAPGRLSDQPCADCLDHSASPGRRRLAAPRRAAFWLVAAILTVTMVGTTLPTPLYVIYQAQWHFSAAIVTVTLAVYAAAVLVTLLLAGRSSDRPGVNPCWPRPSAPAR